MTLRGKHFLLISSILFVIISPLSFFVGLLSSFAVAVSEVTGTQDEYGAIATALLFGFSAYSLFIGITGIVLCNKKSIFVFILATITFALSSLISLVALRDSVSTFTTCLIFIMPIPTLYFVGSFLNTIKRKRKKIKSRTTWTPRPNKYKNTEIVPYNKNFEPSLEDALDCFIRVAA